MQEFYSTFTRSNVVLHLSILESYTVQSVIVDMQMSLENFNHIAIAKYPNSSRNLMLREMVLTCHVKQCILYSSRIQKERMGTFTVYPDGGLIGLKRPQFFFFFFFDRKNPPQLNNSLLMVIFAKPIANVKLLTQAQFTARARPKCNGFCPK